MIRFALGCLCGVILMKNLHEIKDSGLHPWEHRLEYSSKELKVMLKKGIQYANN